MGRAPGRPPGILVAASDDPHAVVLLLPAPGEVRLRARLLEAGSERGIPGLTVQLTQPGAEIARAAASGADGVAELGDLAAGETRIDVLDRDGSTLLSRVVELASGPRALDLDVARPSSLIVRTVDESGAPLEAEVEAAGRRSERGETHVFERVPPGTTTVEVFASGPIPAAVVPGVTLTAGVSVEVEVAVDRGQLAPLEVGALMASGEPREDVAVSLARLDAGGGRASARTGESGTARFGDLPPGRYQVEIEDEIAPPEVVVMAGGEARCVVLRRRGDRTVAGVVFDAKGKPVAHAGVRLSTGEPRERDLETWSVPGTGAFWFHGVPAELRPDACLVVTAEGFDGRRVTLAGVPDPEAFEIQLARAKGSEWVELTGRIDVVCGGFERPRAVWLELRDALGRLQSMWIDDAEGPFEFSFSVPRGSYSVVVTAEGFAPAAFRPLAAGPEERLTLALEYRLDRGRTIVGRIPGPRAFVQLGQEFGGRIVAALDAPGEFRIEKAPTGPLVLEIVATGFERRIVAVEAGAADIDLGNVALERMGQ